MTNEEMAMLLLSAGHQNKQPTDWLAVAIKARELLTPKPPITAVPEGMRVEPLLDGDGNLVPYSPDHDGPFCTRDGKFVRILATDIGDKKYPISFIHDMNGEWSSAIPATSLGRYFYYRDPEDTDRLDIMCARFVPIKREPREFWAHIYKDGDVSLHSSIESAKSDDSSDIVNRIHLREVMEGE